jgi:hypothetical protein
MVKRRYSALTAFCDSIALRKPRNRRSQSVDKHRSDSPSEAVHRSQFESKLDPLVSPDMIKVSDLPQNMDESSLQPVFDEIDGEPFSISVSMETLMDQSHR